MTSARLGAIGQMARERSGRSAYRQRPVPAKVRSSHGAQTSTTEGPMQRLKQAHVIGRFSDDHGTARTPTIQCVTQRGRSDITDSNKPATGRYERAERCNGRRRGEDHRIGRV